MPISTLYAQYGRSFLEDQFLYEEIWYSYNFFDQIKSIGNTF